MGAWPTEAVDRIRRGFEAARDDVRAAGMRWYMRDQFPFLGIQTPERRRLLREATAGLGRPSAEQLLAAARTLWSLPEREYQYAATDLLTRHERVLPADALSEIREFIVTKAWWDTVDALAARVVGPMVLRHPELVPEMDAWIESDDLWVTRSAILHQLTYKARTDEERLFRYCLRRAGDSDFFIRKAIGWALREYSKTAPDAVIAFVSTHGDALSPLSKREALQHVEREKRRADAADQAR